MEREKTHIPPSRVRYEREHPIISFRLSKSLKESLEALQGDEESYTDVIKKLIENNKEYLEDIRKRKYEEGYNTGFKEAKKKYRIWYNCADCGTEQILLPNTRAHSDIIAHLKKDRWVCDECYKKYRK